MSTRDRTRRHCCWLGAILCAASLAGCGQAVLRHALPVKMMETAQLPGTDTKIRYWGDRYDPDLHNDMMQMVKEHPVLADPLDESGPGWGGLALSGGGDCGAFGAGLLCGWTDHGDRPRFRLVTGVSTGALIAPLAFLGPKYDASLRRSYTTISAKNVMEKRAILDWFSWDSIADSWPLQRFAVDIVTDAMVDEIAVEHRKGRRLYIQTVNLDAQRPVVWDMGAIACSSIPGKAKLFRQVMIASAAIPGVFPPQYIKVQADNKTYDEMHVDGGTVSQMLLNTLPVDLAELHKQARAQNPGETRSPRVFIVRNGLMRPEMNQVMPKLMPIVGRSISTMIKAQAETELELMYLTAQNAKIDFHLCYMPDDYERKAKEDFDKVEMNRMFDLGYDMARNGKPWQSKPPQFSEREAVKNVPKR